MSYTMAPRYAACAAINFLFQTVGRALCEISGGGAGCSSIWGCGVSGKLELGESCARHNVPAAMNIRTALKSAMSSVPRMLLQSSYRHIRGDPETTIGENPLTHHHDSGRPCRSCPKQSLVLNFC